MQDTKYEPLFSSFWMGGFECSTHFARPGERLDMLATTRHDVFLAEDYARLGEFGISTVREGIRWHLIEKGPGSYDFSTALQMLRMANEFEIQIIWDLFHFGYPETLDLLTPAFIRHYVEYARAFANLFKNESDATLFVTPINEISFLAFHGAQVGSMNPFLLHRGHALKTQLVRAAIEGMEAIWDILPNARFVHNDPIFNTIADSEDPELHERALEYSYARYQTWDMLAGRIYPELGGAEKYLDILGVDYYPWNQWVYTNDYEFGATLALDDPRYLPLSVFLQEIFERYRRPLLIAETSTEHAERADWLAYISAQAQDALNNRVPLQGICWYPIVSFTGWEDGRICENGLWGYADAHGRRVPDLKLAHEWQRQRAALQRTWHKVTRTTA